MFDAVTAADLPTNGWGYLYYVDGTYANKTAVINRTPGKAHIPTTIGNTPAAKGMVLDCEKGDATNADALAWCQRYPGSNTDLTIYTNTSNWVALRPILATLSTLPNILLAQYDNVASIPTDSKFNIVGKQFKNTPGYDQSVVKDYWPGVDPAPKASTPAAPAVPVITTAQPGYSGAPRLPVWSKYAAQMAKMNDWEKQQFVLALVPEGVYEGYSSNGGYDNNNVFGIFYGENFVSWCVIFDWYVAYIAGLAAVVPKTDNVGSFSSWAQARGQWSEYPSIGAWINFDAGGHTEQVTGFDALYTYSKGGNTVANGANDNGQGDGVHGEHKTLRTSTRIVGYFAIKYPDGVCPPTADPHDYRGGKAVASYSYKLPAIAPTTPTAPTGVDMGVIVTYPKSTTGWKGDFLLANGKLTHIPSPAVEAFLKKVGTPVESWTAAKFNAVFAQIGA